MQTDNQELSFQRCTHQVVLAPLAHVRTARARADREVDARGAEADARANTERRGVGPDLVMRESNRMDA